MKQEREITLGAGTGKYRPYRFQPIPESWHGAWYNIDKMDTAVYMEMHNWCAIHCDDLFSSYGNTFYFKDPADHFEFVLRWGNHLLS